MIFNHIPTKDAKTLEGHGAEYFATVKGYPLNSFYGNSEAEIDQFLNKLHAEASNRYFYSAELSFGASHSQLGSSNKLIVGSRTNASYGWQMAITYGNNADRIRYRQMQGGTWSNWDSGAFVSDLASYLPLVGGTLGNGSKSYPLIIRGSSSYSLIDYMNDANNVRWGSLGFAGAEVPVFLTGDRTNAYGLIHTGNYSKYALPKTGGRIKHPDSNYPLAIQSCNADQAYMDYQDANGVSLGLIGMHGLNVPVVVSGDKAYAWDIHHDGNSAKVVISSTAPSDTSALWVY